MIYTEKQIERFWSNVDILGADECWPWKRSLHSKGYGQVGLRIDGQDKVFKAHKVAWEITHKQRIPAGVHGLHTCDERLCCNPSHIYLQGHPTPGLADDRGVARGSRNGRAVLSERQAILVKYRLNDLTTREVADTIGVNYNTVWDIRHDKTWRHI